MEPRSVTHTGRRHKMTKFERPAVEVVQGRLRLYLTYVTPHDLFLTDDFYSVEQLDPKQSEGYQRLLEPTRSRRLSKHLQEAFNEGYANLPTTIFLATSRPVEYDSHSSVIRFETDNVCPFNVVDGQHRIEGLKDALRHQPGLNDFPLPATIAVNLDDTHQMYHFYIVNTTQKPVDRDLSQQITGRFTRMHGVDELPYLPHWLQSQVDLGLDERALRLVESLNSDQSSPLRGRIRMANDPDRRGRRINQATLVNSVKEHVLAGTNPLSSERDIGRITRVVTNYLQAVSAVFVADIEPEETVAWTGSGVWFFLLISKWVFSAVYASNPRSFTVDSLTSIIESALDELDTEYRELADRDWWRRGRGGASGMNRALARKFGDGFLDALNRSRATEIEL